MQDPISSIIVLDSGRLILRVYDIETIFEEFSITVADKAFNILKEFRINRFTNQVDALVKYLTEENCDYWVGFNNVNFDAQVLQYIIDNHTYWVDKTGAQICAMIWRFSQDVIYQTNNGLFPPYREDWLWAKQMDLFKIHHFDNENRRTSLKWCEYSMDMEDIEEMPLPHVQWTWRNNLQVPEDRMWGNEQFSMIDQYRRNDVKATCMLLKYTLGEVENEVYKGKDKIQDRLDMITEFKLPQEAMNWSDVKVGDELNKLGYMNLKGIKNPKELIELKKNAKRKKRFTFGDCIPPYVTFQTPEFQALYNKVKNVVVKITVDKKEKKEQEFPFSYNKTNYLIARGGLHSNEKNRIVVPTDSEILMDADIGSQYPNAIFKRKLYPSHLGPEWLVMYGGTIQRRLTYKAKGKTDKRAKGIAEMLKLSLNGGGFGKLNEPSNWQYDPFAAFQCTIGNQFEILMLIEALEIGGIHVISANTDGIVCLFDRAKLDTYYQICHEWEDKVQMPVIDGKKLGELEYKEYKKIVQKSVNDYIAIPVEGEVKKKGDFMTEFELNKNRSRRILPLIYENYFTKGIQPEETISSHNSLPDFCIGLKSSKDYHYEGIGQDGKPTIYHKVIRYFVSRDGELLVKVKNEGSEATGPQVSNCEARDYGHWWTTVCNSYGGSSTQQINPKYYLEAAWDFIRSIEASTKKNKRVVHNPAQRNLFS